MHLRGRAAGSTLSSAVVICRARGSPPAQPGQPGSTLRVTADPVVTGAGGAQRCIQQADRRRPLADAW
jgi:hypothetical protein